MFEDEGGVDEVDGSEVEGMLGEVGAVEFEAGELRKTLADGVEVVRVDVNAKDALD
jgi:hypothetical protein